MLGRRILVSQSAPALSPLIQEARDRQRRRRAVLLQIAALAAVLGLAASSHRGAGPVTLGTSDSQAAVSADVRRVIVQFDEALAARDFSRACSLLDPWMGMTTLRTSTDEVGARGGCRQRLAAFVRILGPRLVAELESASTASVEVADSDTGGFTASAQIVVNEAIRRNTWAPVVGVAKNASKARVLITCPPLLCASGFLGQIRARSRSGRS
jgi:hypothetical protein